MSTYRAHTTSSVVKYASACVLSTLVLTAAAMAGCDRPAPKPTPEAMTPVKAAPEEVRTGPLEEEKAPPRVHFRRNKDNTCSWEITGDDVDDILKADRKLRRATSPAPEQKAE